MCSLCLQDIEDKVLKLLSESKGLIVDDEELIAALAGSCSPAYIHSCGAYTPLCSIAPCAVSLLPALCRCCHMAFGKL